MSGRTQRFRRIAVALAGVAAMASVALATPEAASAATTHATTHGTVSHLSTTTKAPKHTASWEW